MKVKGLIFVILFSMMMVSCKKAELPEEELSSKVVTDASDSTDNASKEPVIGDELNKDDEDKSEGSEVNGDNNEEEPEVNEDSHEEDSPKDKVLIDGYDITASVSGTPLKQAYEDYFMIGVGLNGSSPDNATVRSDAMSEIIKYHFNSVTYSNLMKPAYFLDQKGSIDNYNNGYGYPAVNFDMVIDGLEFCKENNIKMRGHVLVWHNQVPEWFFKVGYQNDGEFVDKETMLNRLESYIKQVLTFMQEEYPGVIYAWDVVNEAVENSSGAYETESGFNIRTKFDGTRDNLWYKVIGVDYVEKSFEYARKYADSDVKLFYNDYNTFQVMKTLKIYELASHLKEKGLIDGIGMQGYMNLTYPGIAGGNDSFMTALLKFAELDLEIHLTELSISAPDKSEASMEEQAERYRNLFQILIGLDTASGLSANITSVTVFGLMDNYLFYTNDETNSRLFDKDLQPKPSFYSIMSVVE